MNNNFKGMLYILVSAISFGIMPILAKLAYNGGANTYSVLFLRFLFAAIMLLCFLKYKKISLRLSRKQLARVVLLSIFGFSATSVCMFSSYKYISVGLAAMILYTYPAIVTLLCFIVYKEKLYLRKIISLMISLMGIYCLIGIKTSNYSSIGVILAFSSAILYSSYIVGISHVEIKKINTFVMTFYVSLCACITMGILGITSNTLSVKVSPSSFVCILLLALISTVVALMTFLHGVKIIGPSKASILSTIEPIVSLLLGCIVLGETLTFQLILGSLLIVASVIILTKEEKNKIEESKEVEEVEEVEEVRL